MSHEIFMHIRLVSHILVRLALLRFEIPSYSYIHITVYIGFNCFFFYFHWHPVVAIKLTLKEAVSPPSAPLVVYKCVALCARDSLCFSVQKYLFFVPSTSAFCFTAIFISILFCFTVMILFLKKKIELRLRIFDDVADGKLGLFDLDLLKCRLV